MAARDKFHLDQRVKASAKSVVAHVNRYGDLGTVSGFGNQKKNPNLVRISRDGRRTVVSYHMDFWEPCE